MASFGIGIRWLMKFAQIGHFPQPHHRIPPNSHSLCLFAQLIRRNSLKKQCIKYSENSVDFSLTFLFSVRESVSARLNLHNIKKISECGKPP
jgi:hypothetical protein